MGRLFWKFFFFCLLAQMITIVGVTTAIGLRNRALAAANPEVEAPRRGPRLVGAAFVTLERGGVPALRVLLDDWSRVGVPPVYAVDEQGAELLGRDVAAADVEQARRAIDDAAHPSGARTYAADDGHTYLLFERRPEFRAGGPPRPHPREHFLPFEPIVGGLIASLIFATGIAWYVSKPIRSLRAGFAAAARGDLDVRLGSRMGGRRDELADLGRDFDRTSLQLKALMDGQRRLLHDVSHELRSPLARLQIAIGLARQQPEKLDAWIERIERETVRMDRLVGELLTLSRVEAGVLGESAEPVDVAELIHEVVEDAQFEADANGRKVQWTIDVDALARTVLNGRAELLHRAIENVVRNAVKHTADGGHVEVSGRLDARAHELTLVISDDGPGVPEVELESIFQPFYRGAGAKGTDGHGIGLAIARSVIALHRGSIRARNRAGSGLAVEIRLPV